jgi:hypothetical protein
VAAGACAKANVAPKINVANKAAVFFMNAISSNWLFQVGGVNESNNAAEADGQTQQTTSAAHLRSPSAEAEEGDHKSEKSHQYSEYCHVLSPLFLVVFPRFALQEEHGRAYQQDNAETDQ